MPSFFPLGATALGEPRPPQQPVSIALCLSSSLSTALSSLLWSLLQRHPSISNEVCNCIKFRKVQCQLLAQTLFLYQL